MYKTILVAALIFCQGYPVLAQEINGTHGVNNFDGIVVGTYAGAAPAGNNQRYTVGGIVGYRHVAAGNLSLGIELKAGKINDSGYAGPTEIIGVGQAGYVLSDDFLVYASLGVAVEHNAASAIFATPARNDYFAATGVGAEFAASKPIHVRTEVMSLWDARGANQFNARGTAGLVAAFKKRQSGARRGRE